MGTLIAWMTFPPRTVTTLRTERSASYHLMNCWVTIAMLKPAEMLLYPAQSLMTLMGIPPRTVTTLRTERSASNHLMNCWVTIAMSDDMDGYSSTNRDDSADGEKCIEPSHELLGDYCLK